MKGDRLKAIGLLWPSVELEPGIYWFWPKPRITPQALMLQPFWCCDSARALGSFGLLKQLLQLPKGHAMAVYCPGTLTWNRPVCRRDLWPKPCLGRRTGQEALEEKGVAWRGKATSLLENPSLFLEIQCERRRAAFFLGCVNPSKDC